MTTVATVDHRWHYPEPAVAEKYDLWPTGFADQVITSRKIEPYAGDTLRWLEYFSTFLPSKVKPESIVTLWTRYPEDSWERIVAEEYWGRLNMMLLHLLYLGLESKDQVLLEFCARGYDECVTSQPNLEDSIYKNQGIAWNLLKKPEAKAKAMGAFREFLRVARPGSASNEERQHMHRTVEAFFTEHDKKAS